MRSAELKTLRPIKGVKLWDQILYIMAYGQPRRYIGKEEKPEFFISNLTHTKITVTFNRFQ